jgi:hypothetical protein
MRDSLPVIIIEKSVVVGTPIAIRADTPDQNHKGRDKGQENTSGGKQDFRPTS